MLIPLAHTEVPSKNPCNNHSMKEEEAGTCPKLYDLELPPRHTFP